MFEHLDDLNPPVADAATRRTVAQRAAALRTRQRRLVALGTAAFLTTAGSGIGIALANQGGGQSGVHVFIHPPTSVVVPTTTTTSPTTLPAILPTTTVAPTTTTELAAADTLNCGALVPANPAPGTAQAANATLGSVTARLGGSAATAYGEPSLNNAMLTVTENGRAVVSQTVSPPKGVVGPTPAVIPWALSAAAPTAYSPPLCVARFAGSTEPTVLLGLNLGGVHCCTILRTVGVPSGAMTDTDLRNVGADVIAHAGGALIVSGDDAFNYAFASYAESGVPIKVLEVRNGLLVDTTRQHLDLVAHDAPRWLALFNQLSGPGQSGLGMLAAWVGDECLLGRFSSAWALVNQYNAQGRLTGTSLWPTGSAYVTALRTFLSQHGYC
jgi:hypothetical protein